MAGCLESALLLLLLLLAEVSPLRTAPSPPGRCGVENEYWKKSYGLPSDGLPSDGLPSDGLPSGSQDPSVLSCTQYPASAQNSPELVPNLSSGSASPAGGNRCVAAAEACTADARCQQLRSEYVARCLDRAAAGDWTGAGGCVRLRCRRALRRFFALGPPALTHALLFCRCESPACAERRRQTFAPACAFAGPGPAPPSCLKALERCERSRLCRPRLLAFQASCAPVPGPRHGCPEEQGARCLPAYAGLIGTAITPNYLDNVSARVAPWCSCGDSGNRLEECEAFRTLFTRNPCLDGAMQAFNALWPSVLQDRQNPYQNIGHHFPQVSLISILTALALRVLL